MTKDLGLRTKYLYQWLYFHWQKVSLALLLALPLFVANQYYMRVIINVGIYILLALGLNIVVGFCGLLDLGFIAFFGIGAYTSALLATKAAFSFWMALPFAVFLGALFGVLLGFPTLKLKGDYLAIVTLGFGEIVRLAFTNMEWLTQGPRGIPGIPPPNVPFTETGIFLHDRRFTYLLYYYLILALVLFTLVAVSRLRHSKVGRAWLAIQQDEIAASCMGIPLARYKTFAYATGAAFGALGGAYFAHFQQAVSPNSFIFFESCMVLCMVVVGGRGSLFGPVVGATVLSASPELLRGVQGGEEYRYLIFGAMMVAVAVLRPQGLIPAK